MEYRQQWESLAGRAVILRDSLYKSQFVTDKMVENLGSFDHRLSNLESAMRPTQVWCESHLSWSEFRLPPHPFSDSEGFWILNGDPQMLLQMRTHSIRMAHENIDKTLKSADVILIQLDLSREVCMTVPFTYVCNALAI